MPIAFLDFNLRFNPSIRCFQPQKRGYIKEPSTIGHQCHLYQYYRSPILCIRQRRKLLHLTNCPKRSELKNLWDFLRQSYNRRSSSCSAFSIFETTFFQQKQDNRGEPSSSQAWPVSSLARKALARYVTIQFVIEEKSWLGSILASLIGSQV